MDIRQLNGLQIDEYELVDLIGDGGMSAVYRAYQEELDRSVAVKILAGALAEEPGYLERFQQEAKMAASLEHPHIVPVYDFGVHEQLSYVAMRLLHNTLTDRIFSTQSMTLNDILIMLESIARALDYAHSRGVVHRDVKPSNIMFDEQGTPYLVDFGIAKAVQSDLNMTSEQVVMGTPSYMSPEQWRDDPVSSKVDQYALAIVMFQVLTGQLPYTADTPSQLMYKHLNTEPPLANTVNPNLSPAVADVLRRGMAKDPNQRYPLLSNFSNALRQALTRRSAQQQPIQQAPRPTAPTHPRQAPVQQPASRISTPYSEREPGQATLMMRAAQGGLIGIGLILVIIIVVILGIIFVFAPEMTDDPTAVPIPTEAANAAPTQPEIILTDRSEPVEAITVVGPIITPDVDFVGMDASNARQLAILYPISRDPVRDARYSPNGAMVASAHGNGVLRLWRAGTGEPPLELHGHTDVVDALAFSPDSNFIVSSGNDTTIRIWSTATGQEAARYLGHTAPVRDVAFHPGGTLLATASEDGTLKLWDLSTGNLVRSISPDGSRLLAVVFSPEGSTVATGSNSGIVSLYDVQSGGLLSTLQGHTEEVRSVAFSPDGRYIASASADNHIIVWRRDNGQQVQRMNHGNDVWVITFNPDSTLLASGGRDNNLRLWDVASGNELANLTGHNGWVLGVSFSPDGSTILTGSGDGSVRLWGVR